MLYWIPIDLNITQVYKVNHAPGSAGVLNSYLHSSPPAEIIRLDICSIRLFHIVFYTHHLFTLLISDIKLAYYQLQVFRNNEVFRITSYAESYKIPVLHSFVGPFCCNHTYLYTARGPLRKQVCFRGTEIILYLLSDQPLFSSKCVTYKSAYRNAGKD